MQAFINLSSKVNTINLAYAKQLGLYNRQTNVEAQKIDGSYLKIFEIIIASFLL